MKDKIIILDGHFPTNNKDKLLKKKKIKIPNDFNLVIIKPIFEKIPIFDLLKKIPESDVFFINVNIFEEKEDLLLLLGYLKGSETYVFLYDDNSQIPNYLTNILSEKKYIYFLKFQDSEHLNISQVITYINNNIKTNKRG